MTRPDRSLSKSRSARSLGLLLASGLVAAGCHATPDSNVAELAAQVAIGADPAMLPSCRELGPVEAHAVTIAGARQKLQREALFRGANRVVLLEEGHGTSPWGRPQLAPGVPMDANSLVKGIGYACPGPALLPSLRGVTTVPAGKIVVDSAKPQGCDRVGTKIQASAGATAGAAEDGLRNGAVVFNANYVHITDHEASGAPGLTGQPYACPIGP